MSNKMGTVTRFGIAVTALVASNGVGAFTCSSAVDGLTSTNARSRSNRSTFLSVTMQPGLEDMLADDAEEEPEEYILSPNEIDAEAVESVSEPGPSPSFLHASALSSIRSQWARGENDSGSPEYQIAGMTERISYLTGHMKANPKDFSTRRGLLALVNKRRRLLNYLFEQDQAKYSEIVGALGIRHKAPGRVMSRDEQYGQFNSKKKK